MEGEQEEFGGFGGFWGGMGKMEEIEGILGGDGGGVGLGKGVRRLLEVLLGELLVI